jgi:hypothetical protein
MGRLGTRRNHSKSKARMLGKLAPRRPSAAMVVALMALFVALSGASYAAIQIPKGSVDSRAIKNGAVKRGDLGKNAVDSGKVRDGSLQAADFAAGTLVKGGKGEPGEKGERGPQGPPGKDAEFAGRAAAGDLTGAYPAPAIAAGAVNGDKVADGSLTGADVDESTLTGVVKGAGQVLSREATGAAGGSAADVVTILAVPGAFEVIAACASNAGIELAFINRNAQPAFVWRDSGGANPTTRSLATNHFDGTTLQSGPDMAIWQGTAGGRRVTVTASGEFNEGGQVDTCRFQAHALVSE